MESVLRILTLYKQHYLTKYSENYKWSYSALGYYDGMEIQKVKKHNENRLAFTNSNVPDLTDLWYEIAQNVLTGEGAYGQQNISLLKFGDGEIIKAEHLFWKNPSAFLCATFIQVDRTYDITKISNSIEQELNSNNAIKAVIYRTLDNADAVLFMKSKQYNKIISALEILGNRSDIYYSHSILGISQECLERISTDDNAGELYDETEMVDEAVLDIVSRGSKKAAEYIEKVNETGTYSYVLGHSDIIYRMPDITIKSILEKLTDKGTLNHNNGLYGEGIYNVETVLKNKNTDYVHKNTVPVIPSETTTGEAERSWCKGKIKDLEKDLDLISAQKDERMYSYYQAMIQSLNMLNQYEMSQFSKTIFYMIFPSLELFHEQFREKLKPHDKLECKELNKVKTSIARYLEAVDTIILHAVHTDQNFLMVPGYSGVLYDIPTQLCFSYMAFMGLLIDCLNDTSNSRYECFLVPTLQINTETKFIGFDLSPNNRLIQVTIPQRLLFMQRSTLLTLAHEAAHYVGDHTRNRKLRLNKMIRIFGYVMAEYIYNKLTSEYNGEYKEDRKDLIELVLKQKASVTIYLTKKINAILKRHLEQEKANERFHWHILELYISKVCDSVMLDMDFELRNLIRTIPQEGFKILGKENNHEILLQLEDIYEEIEQRLREWVSDGLSEQMTRIIEYGISEMYSDVVSIMTLDAEWKYYIEAYLVGEGSLIQNSPDLDSSIPLDSLTENRIAVVVDTLTDRELDLNPSMHSREASSWKSLYNEVKSKEKNVIHEIVMAVEERISNEHNAGKKQYNQSLKTESSSSDNIRKAMKDELEDIIYSIDAVWKHEKEYLRKCADDIGSYLEFKEEKTKKCNLILFRQYYLNFTRNDNTNFLKYMDLLKEKYMTLIKQRYNAALTKMYTETSKV